MLIICCWSLSIYCVNICTNFIFIFESLNIGSHDISSNFFYWSKAGGGGGRGGGSSI